MRDVRPFLDVLTDIFGNLQDIVRSEIRLATAEIANQLRSARSSAIALGVALLCSAFTILFLLLSGMYALTQAMPTWGAALCVALIMALCSCLAFVIAGRRARARRNIASTTSAAFGRI